MFDPRPTEEPRLQPPGAGLPKMELHFARALFAFARVTGNRASFNARFSGEREKIRLLVGGCDADLGARRVLIRRLPGLEDSSRFWSVWMTLDHVRIVHQGMVGVIGSLLREVMPPGVASTATVKPSPAADRTVLARYEESCEAVLSSVEGFTSLKTRARYAHPWFGPLDAAAWHALAGTHLAIHRVQIERILQALPAHSPG